MHKRSSNLRTPFPLGFRVSADNYVHLRTKFIDTSNGQVPLALLQSQNTAAGGAAAQNSSTFKIFSSDSALSNAPGTASGATPSRDDENVSEIQAHVTVSAISKKENRAQLLRKIDELTKRIDRLRATARRNDSKLKDKAKAYKEALRKAREANRAMELHVREQLREQAARHQLQQRQISLWQLNAKFTRAIVRKSFNQWKATARGTSKVARFVTKYWLHGNLHTAWRCWHRFVTHERLKETMVFRLLTVLQRSGRTLKHEFFVRWQRSTTQKRLEEARVDSAHHRAAHYLRQVLSSQRRRVFHEWKAAAKHSCLQKTLIGRVAVRWRLQTTELAFRRWKEVCQLHRALHSLQRRYASAEARLVLSFVFRHLSTHVNEQKIIAKGIKAVERFQLRQGFSRWRVWEAVGCTYWKLRYESCQRKLDKTEKQFASKKNEWQRLGELSNRTWQELIVNDRNERQAEVKEFVAQWKGTVAQAQSNLKKYKRLHAALNEKAITWSQIAADLKHGLELQKKCLEYVHTSDVLHKSLTCRAPMLLVQRRCRFRDRFCAQLPRHHVCAFFIL